MNSTKLRVVDRSKPKPRPKAKKSKSSTYTLGCEKRLATFKEEFKEFFENKLNEQNLDFGEFYKGVISSTANDDHKARHKRSQMNSVVMQNNNDAEKGTMLFENDKVLGFQM